MNVSIILRIGFLFVVFIVFLLAQWLKKNTADELWAPCERELSGDRTAKILKAHWTISYYVMIFVITVLFILYAVYRIAPKDSDLEFFTLFSLIFFSLPIIIIIPISFYTLTYKMHLGNETFEIGNSIYKKCIPLADLKEGLSYSQPTIKDLCIVFYTRRKPIKIKYAAYAGGPDFIRCLCEEIGAAVPTKILEKGSE